jgi:kynureninase
MVRMAQYATAGEKDQFSTPSSRKALLAGTGDGEQESVYLAGNSLGLMPKRTPELLSQELQVARCTRADCPFVRDRELSPEIRELVVLVEVGREF